jgi:lipoprotein-anchoring transpeptidase ErfK/SrfK
MEVVPSFGSLRSRCLTRWVAVLVLLPLAVLWPEDPSLACTTPASDRSLAPVQYSIVQGEVQRKVIKSASDAGIALLEKLNRSDRQHLPRLRGLVVPNQMDRPELDYSPLARVFEAAKRHQKIIVVNLAHQVFGAYEWGVLTRWGPISSGKKTSPTPTGAYRLTWRSKGHCSSIDPDWYMSWYFNFESGRGLAFHEYSLPGVPASHGCIRLLSRDAEWIYSWGEGWECGVTPAARPGTPVLIWAPYVFTEPVPWRDLQKLVEPIPLNDLSPLLGEFQ